jgi:hypothetical protein
MKFVQLKAGNAQRTRLSRLGAGVSSFPQTMSHRLATILALSCALALPAASAQAADPLLSGYAGPGGGEQVVLGSTTLKTTNKASSASTSSGSSSSSQSGADASLKAPTSSSTTASKGSSGESNGASSTLTRKPQRKKSSSSSSKDAGDDAKTTTTGSAGTTTTATTTLAGAPEVVAYPTRAGEVSGLPISAAGILLIVIGVAAATLLGLGLRRFSGSDDRQDPQVSA